MSQFSSLRVALIAAAVLLACQAKPPPAAPNDPAHLGQSSRPLFVNGGFEDGNLGGWTVSTNLNSRGIVNFPPATITDLGLQSGGNNYTSVVTGPTDGVVPAGLSAKSTLRVPRYGNNVAVVNAQGYNYNVNTLKQTMTITNADVDMADGKAHVRFAIAPVLQNPNHVNAAQPYYWVQLRNVTKSTMLFQTFKYSNQVGVPWKSDPADASVLYTDWQSFDISPGAAQLAVGDQVEIQVVAAGCGQSGHWGEVYVDAFGSSIPGLQVTAVAPQSVNTGSQLTYTFNYSNGGTGASSNTIIQETLPAGTTFASSNAPGATCSYPAVGGTGDVICNIGTLNPASSGSFTVTVNVTASAGGIVSNGTYSIYSDGISPLIGPLVTTAITSSVTYADLWSTVTDGVAAVNWGASDTYTMVVGNKGPSAANGAVVSAPIPANIAAWTWTCAATGGASCITSSGSGAINSAVNLPANGSVTYTVLARVAAGAGSSTISSLVAMSTPSGVTDSDSTNNTAVDYDQVGTLRTLTVTKVGDGVGTVASSPAAIRCEIACSSASALFLDGTALVLQATTAPGNRFIRWTDGPCTGTSSPTCTVTLSADTTAAVQFDAGDWAVVSSASGGGTVSCSTPVLNGASSTCTIMPATRHRLTVLTDNGTSVIGSVQGGTYTMSNITGDHAVAATFAANSATVSLSANLASSTYAQPITLTATVAAVAPSGAPGGTVTFTVGGDTLCSAVGLAGGTATCTTPAIPVGPQAVVATYSGDSTYPPATSSSLSLAVSRGTTSLGLSATPNPAYPATTVTVTATLSPGWSLSAPTGTVAFTEGAAPIIGCSAVTLTGLSATCTISGMVVGSHTLQAIYSGDGNYAGSTSPTYTATINPCPTSTVIQIAPTTSAYGQSTALSALVLSLVPGADLPTGTVTFQDGGTPIAGCTAAALYPSGLVICVASGLTVGSHTLTAVYSGDSTFAASTSSGASATVSKSPTALSVVGTPSSSLVGQAVTFTAAVAGSWPGSAAPTGSVTFTSGATTLCAGAVLSGGAASCTGTSLGVGSDTVTATYIGDARFNGSSGGAVQVVSKGSTATSVSGVPLLSLFGQAVTLTATVVAVSPAAGTPAGTVAFTEGARTLCAAAALSRGSATCTVASLSVGTHAITAAYSADASFDASSSTWSQVVERGASSTTVGSAPDPSVFGQAVTLSAIVAASGAASATPTGTVSFTADGTVLCAAAVGSGVAATCTAASLPVGSHAIGATYSGDGNLEGSTAAGSQVVKKGSTATTVASSADPSVSGQAVTFTSTVTVDAPASATPSGTIDFLDGAVVLCAAVPVSSSEADCTVSNLSVASHGIRAVYSGDGNLAGSTSSALAQVVNRGATTTTLASDHAPSLLGQAVTFTAAVGLTGPAGGTPTGTVTFTDGAVNLCANVALTGGTAACTVSNLAVAHSAAHPIVATYSGDAGYGGSSSNPLDQVVNPAPTAVILSASPSPVVFHGVLTLTARVAVVSPALGTAMGTVAFKDGVTILCAAADLDGTGVATCTVHDVPVGPRSLTASYPGDGSDFLASSSSALNLEVDQAATSLSLTTDKSPSASGQMVTFTATIVVDPSSSGDPAGIVDFTEGGTTLCAAAPVSAGSATCATADLAVGTQLVTATYGGDAEFLGAARSVSQVVSKSAAAVALVTSGSPSVYAGPVTFAATVSATAPGAGVPTGMVAFLDGPLLIGAGTLTGGVATLSTTALASGTHAITAQYLGDGQFVSNTSSAVAQRIDLAGCQLVLGTGSPSASVFGQPVTYAITGVAEIPSAAIPDGTVLVYDGPRLVGSVALDALGQATFTTSALGVGSHSLTAALVANARFGASTSSAVGQTVAQAPSSIGLVSSLDPSIFGTAVTFTATVAPVAPGAGVPGGTVAFRDGSTVIGTAVLDLSGTATCATAALAAGTHAVSAVYSGDGNFGGSTTASTTDQVVNRVSSSVAVAIQPAQTVFGQPVTVSVAVGSIAGTPPGQVQVEIDGSLAAPITLDGQGRATYTNSALSVGDHAVVVHYLGASDYLAADSPAWAHHIAKAGSAVVLASSPPQTAFGQPVTLTASVQAAEPGSGRPTGAVHFYDGGTVLGSGTVDPNSGQAILTSTSLAPGGHSITASYMGDGIFLAGDSIAISHQVNPILTVSTSGSGTVASRPVGIDCGPSCSAEFPYGASVGLSATPSAGWGFAGWSGACSGLGACTVTLDALRAVSAEFRLINVVAWGNNGYGQTTVPGGSTGMIAIAAGTYHTLAVRSDGTVVAWGNNGLGQTAVPAGLTGVVAVAAGSSHSVALERDGTVVAWGDNSYGQAKVPAGLTGVATIAAGAYHTVAVERDGTLVAWGSNSYGQAKIPAGLTGVVAVAAGTYHTAALRSDGTVVAWGWNGYGQTAVPPGLTGVVSIGAGMGHTVALRSDGTVVSWGWNGYGQAAVPAGLTGVIAVAAGTYHTVALQGDGTVVAWGDNSYGQATMPAGLTGVVAIAAGSGDTVALRR